MLQYKENQIQTSTSNTQLSSKGVAAYLRVSTEKQDSNTSKQTQLNLIKQKIVEKNLTNRELIIYTDTESASKKPKSENIDSDNIFYRNGLNQLIFDARLGKFDTLIVYSHDRLTRNVYESLMLKYIFRKLNITVIYCRAGEDLNSENQKINDFFENLLNNIAQLESNLIGARVKLANEYKIKNNLWAGGPPPYGYKLSKIQNGSLTKSKLEISYAEAQIVKEIFEYYIHGISPKEIANKIKQKYPQNQDRKWTVNTIKSILSNEDYLGYIVWNKKGGARNPVKYNNPIRSNLNSQNTIIPQEKWHEAIKIKQILKENPKSISTPFLLKDILVCKDCKEKLKAKNNGKNKPRAYYCSKIKGKWEFCIDAELIESSVLSKIAEDFNNLIKDEHIFNKFYDAYANSFRENLDFLSKEKEELREQLNDIELSLLKCDESIRELSLNLPQDDIPQHDEQKIFIESLYELKTYLTLHKQDILSKLNYVESNLSENILDKETLKIQILNLFNRFQSAHKDTKANQNKYFRILLFDILYKVYINHKKEVEIVYKRFC